VWPSPLRLAAITRRMPWARGSRCSTARWARPPAPRRPETMLFPVVRLVRLESKLLCGNLCLSTLRPNRDDRIYKTTMTKEPIRGIFTPNLVPLDDDGQINEPELRRYVDWLIDRGVHGLYPNGSTGEFTRFTPDE